MKRYLAPMIIALEPRLMFDGAAVADAAHAAPDAAAKALIPAVAAPVEVRAADPSKDNGKKEVAFVDTSLANWSSVVNALGSSRPGIGIELIAGGQSGLAQIAAWAEKNSGYDAVHILSQGGEGSMKIGSDIVTDATLSTAVAQAELAEIGAALKSGGDVLLYGSNIAAGTDGGLFVADLAAGTGATVAAADHGVGDAARGGSWTLNVVTEQSVAITALDVPGYLGLLDLGGQAGGSGGAVLIQGADPARDGGKLEVAFVDTSLADWQTLVTGIETSRPGIEIELIDATESGLAQMAAWAASHSGYDAIHVLSHGNTAELYLGTDDIGQTTLDDASVQGRWAAVGNALKANGDILLYGCDIAQGETGTRFVADIAAASGADVAASSALVGAASLGGSWTLDRSTGAVDVSALSIAAYDDTLAQVTFNMANHSGTTISSNGYTFYYQGTRLSQYAGSFTYPTDTTLNQVVLDFTGDSKLSLYMISPNWNLVGLQYWSDSTYTADVSATGGKSATIQLKSGGWQTLTAADIVSGSSNIFSANQTIMITIPLYKEFALASIIVDPILNPTTTVSSVSLSADTGVSASDFITKTAAQTISGTLSANTASGETVQVSVDGGTTWSTATNTVGSNTFSLSGATLLSGSQTIKVKVANGSGDGTVYSQAYTLDTTAPAITGVTVTAGNYKAGSSVPVTISLNGASDDISSLDGGTVNGYALVFDSRTTNAVTAHFVATSGGSEIASGANVGVSGLILTDTAGNSSTIYANAALTTSGVVVDTNAATDIAIGGSSSASRYAGGAVGAVVGTLSATDASTINDTVTYALYSGNNNSFDTSGNQSFQIVSGKLALAQALTSGTTYNVALQVTDQGGNSFIKQFAITGAGPTVTAAATASYTERTAAATLSGALSLTDSASSTMTGATVKISAGLTSGDSLSCGTGTSGITAAYDSQTGILTLSGNASLAAYQAVLDTVTFANATNHDPTASSATRSIAWQVHDEFADGPAASTTLTVNPVNDPPTLTADAQSQSIRTAQTLSPALFANVVVGTVESGQTISTVVLTVSNVADGAAEILSVNNAPISLTTTAQTRYGSSNLLYQVAVNGTTATVTLSGVTPFTAADVQTMLANVAYKNSNSATATTAGDRTVTVTSITDSGGTANQGVDTTALSLNATIHLVANDQPALSIPGAIKSSDLSPVAISGVTVTDAIGAETYQADITSSGGQITVSVAAGAQVTGNGTSVIRISGSKTQINTALAGMTFTPPGYGNQTITVTVSDLGTTYIGGAKSGTGSISFKAEAPIPPVQQVIQAQVNDTSSVKTAVPPDTATLPVVTIANLNGNAPTISGLPIIAAIRAESSPPPANPPIPSIAPPSGESPNRTTALSGSLSSAGTGIFRVAVLAESGQGGETSLVVAKPIGLVDAVGRVNFSVPTDAFAVSRADASVTLSATSADGRALPAWLSFNPATGVFEGTPPPGENAVVVKVIARDQAGNEAAQLVKIQIRRQAAQADHGHGEKPTFSGRAGLSSQIAAARGGPSAQLAALARALGKVA